MVGSYVETFFKNRKKNNNFPPFRVYFLKELLFELKCRPFGAAVTIVYAGIGKLGLRSLNVNI